jgi:hypothetical protein
MLMKVKMGADSSSANLSYWAVRGHERNFCTQAYDRSKMATKAQKQTV